MKRLFTILVFLAFANSITAQEENLGILIQLHEQYTPEQFVKVMPDLAFEKTVIRQLNIHFFKSKNAKSFNANQLEQHLMVKDAMKNGGIERRTTQPNDARFGVQWALERIGMPQVWDISTGGKTVTGDDIVVAIIDTDFSITHEDLIENIWQNPREVPNNGVDDDQNGLIDDINGWNFDRDQDTHIAGIHGTSVSGIIGGKGNNEIGVSGINWDINLMFLSYDNAGGSIPEIFAAYEYVTDMRRRYNESNGEEGAFIVAVNSSFGLRDPKICPENDMWNEAHNMMGEVGILIAAAAKNSPIDSDAVGDQPSACPSEAIISVVSTDEDDLRWQGSAFGQTTMDIGAPGVNILTTRGDEGYREFDANSSATPHISGAIAMLYSLPCQKLANMALSQPAEAAQLVRSAILEGVDPLPTLEKFTATGGRLNVFNAVQNIETFCDPDPNVGEEFVVTNLFPNPVSDFLNVVYETPDIEPFTLRIFDSIGRLLVETEINPCCFKEAAEQIDVRTFQNGIYFLQVDNGEEKSVKSFVVGY
ncbi:MAG: S8/S53 family peptidase [Bacteroidota bacterium]